ncbi:MAG TPA: hypothetical protein VGJ64_04525, partial [Gemmatimonadaceae bacterium]
MTLRKFAIGAVVALVFSVGCDNSDPFAAQLPTSQDVFTLFALSGTPPAYPSGLNTYGRTPTRVDGTASFDVAFDLNAEGNAILYPVKLIVSSVGGDRPVGLRKVSGTFDQVTEAPTGTYQTDSAVVASKGEVVVVQANRGISGDVCAFNVSPYIYTKILVDS